VISWFQNLLAFKFNLYRYVKEEFARANAADYALYTAAQSRLEDRIKNAEPSYARNVRWMSSLNAWLETRLAAEPAFQAAAAMPRATAASTPCPEGQGGAVQVEFS
jgi:hypothetical protein